MVPASTTWSATEVPLAVGMIERIDVPPSWAAPTMVQVAPASVVRRMPIGPPTGPPDAKAPVPA